MWVFYLLALVPILVGAVLTLFRKEITWIEWIVNSVVAVAVAGIFNLAAYIGMTSDTETWSGRIVQVTYYPTWVEEYQEAVYRTEYYTTRDSKGHTQSHTRRVFSHYETRHRTHTEHWAATTSFGAGRDEVNIPRIDYDNLKAKWGTQEVSVNGHKNGFDSGDPNIYTVKENPEVIIPITKQVSWTNKVKAAPSAFSFPKVPETAKVYVYPENQNWRKSSRIIGPASSEVDILDWDRMNSRLGPNKGVNVILVSFPQMGDCDNALGKLQEAKWLRGKKNDLVLCYGGESPTMATWAYVFGWTESEPVKRNLEQILLKNEIKTEIIPLIEQEIKTNYVKKDWHKFDYVSVEPPRWSYYVMVASVFIVQLIGYLVSFFNETTKEVVRRCWKR